MPNTTIKILNMQSDECLRLVMNAIQDLPCIGHVEVSMSTGEASIEHTSSTSTKRASAAERQMQPL